jgi:hypothetical protein
MPFKRFALNRTAAPPLRLNLTAYDYADATQLRAISPARIHDSLGRWV